MPPFKPRSATISTTCRRYDAVLADPTAHDVPTRRHLSQADLARSCHLPAPSFTHH